MKILSIDPGIVNLGYIYAELSFEEPEGGSRYKKLLLNENYSMTKDTMQQNIRVIDCDRVDITKVKHCIVPYHDCKLHHDRCIPDYIDHFIQETKYFEECDVLLLERQPPLGITNIQDLLFKLFRNKVILIHPNSIHKYFTLSSEYSQRKVQSEHVCDVYLKEFKNFQFQSRRHDISDALLLLIYYYKTEVDKLIKIDSLDPKIIQDFEQFRFTKGNSI
jgi:hypothetical protein